MQISEICWLRHLRGSLKREYVVSFKGRRGVFMIPLLPYDIPTWPNGYHVPWKVPSNREALSMDWIRLGVPLSSYPVGIL